MTVVVKFILALTLELFCFFFSLQKDQSSKLIQGFSSAHRDNFSEYFNHLLTKDDNLSELVKIFKNESHWYKEYAKDKLAKKIEIERR